MKTKGSVLVRSICAVLMMVMVVSAVFVPMSIGVSAATINVTDDTTVLFSFEDSENPVRSNSEAADNINMTRGGDGIGCASWGMSVKTVDGINAIGAANNNKVTYPDQGGYRLNNNDGVYALAPSSTYVVSFKIRVTSLTKSFSGSNTAVVSTVKMGYGFTNSNTDGNSISDMKVALSDVLTSKADSETFVLTDARGSKEYLPGEEWHEVSYIFNTPNDFGVYSNTFGFYSKNYYGINYLIDEVSVTKLGSNTGAAVLIDEYYNTAEIVMGTVGSDIPLPTLTTDEEGHSFNGWFKDEDRTQAADGAKFTAATQTLYTKWQAPVSITFVDGLNNKNYEVTGAAGQPFSYPADPVDTVNNPEQYWFMGWYTTESYTEEFTETVLGYSNIKVYAKWAEEYSDAVEDFEDYSSDKRSETTEGGIKYYANRFIFGYAMEKKADPTKDTPNTIVEFEWNSATTKQPDVAGSYDAATRYASLDNMILMEDANLISGVTYRASFEYYVEKINDTQSVTVFPFNAHHKTVWGDAISFGSTQGAKHQITATDKDGQWHKGEFTFTMQYATPTVTAIYLLSSLGENTDVVIYYDNIMFEAVQPYESSVTYILNNGEKDVTYVGKRGEALPALIPENNGLSFVGWFKDEALTTRYEGTVYERNSIILYAKYAGKVIEFDNYSYANYNGTFADQSCIIDKTQNVGVSDNFALRWHYDGDAVWKVENGKNVYFADRSTILDHKVKLCDLDNNTTYELTYYVKTEAANANFTIRVVTGCTSDIWGGGVQSYDTTIGYVKADSVGKGYVKKTAIFTTNFLKDTKDRDAATAYFLLASDKADMNVDINVLIDRVTFVPVTDDVLIFNSNCAGDNAYQIGNAGDAINFPTLSNGDAKFLGWYTDADCENPFNETVMAEGITNVYAKWSATAITFADYTYDYADRNKFAVSMSIVNESGAGYDDDYKLAWHLDGNQVRNYNSDGTAVYMKARVENGMDNMARLATVQNKTAYKITYYYKASAKSNYDANITFATGNGDSVWGGGYVSYAYTKQSVPLKVTEWTKAETYLVTDFGAANADKLFIQITGDVAAGTEGIDIYVDIDNVLIEKVEKPYIVYDGQNGSAIKIVSGKPGEQIVAPSTPIKNGFVFTGWYLDKETTVLFEETVFKAGESYVVYAGYKRASYVLYDFENYGISQVPGWNVYGNGAEIGKFGKQTSGVTSFKMDRTNEETRNRLGHFVIGGDGIRFELDPSKKYVVSFKYYVAQRGSEPMSIYFRSGHEKSAFSNIAKVSDTMSLNVVADLNVWKTATLIIDPAKIPEGGNSLYMIFEKGFEFILYIDDLSLTTLPAGHTAYIVDNGDSKSVPQYVSGPIGASFASKLPQNPTKDNHIFIGYTKYDENSNSEELTKENMVFSKDYMRIKANFVRLETIQDFDGDYSLLFATYADYSAIDFDWEHYDSKAEGNSADNVTSGQYSLHRKGDSYFFENAQLLTQAQMLTPGERYTITLKVKMGKYLQTDGALKVVSNRSPFYPWATTGDYYPLIAMSDLTDGTWHEISYTFNAVECYLSLQSPGYCELFIDDIVIKRVEKDVPLSTPISFTEYVPAKRDKDGNLVKRDTSIDVKTIIDASLYEKQFNWLLAIIIGGAVVVLGGAAALIVVLVKKKRKKTV